MLRRSLVPLSLGMVLSTMACASDPPANPAGANAPLRSPVSPVTAPASGGGAETQTVELALDVQQTVAGVELLWTDVDDSRCPKDVTCVWAGEVIIHLRVVDAGDANMLLLTLGPRGGETSQTGNHHYRLISVNPYPVSTEKTERGARRATIEIKAR